jgi:hypothetical protein
VFTLDKDFTFVSKSPQLSTVEVTFTGQILDCNFLFPSGLTFEEITDTQWAVKIGDETIKTYESAAVGDGTGIEFRAGPVLLWDEVPYPAYLSLPPATVDLPSDADEIAAALGTQYEMAAYREIYLSINGEKAESWYIPSVRSRRIKYLTASRIYYGVTDAEFVAAGNVMPTITKNIQLETGNDRLSGMYLSERIVKTVQATANTLDKFIYTFNELNRAWESSPVVPGSADKQTLTFHVWHRTPTTPPLGINHANLCTEALRETGAWTPDRAWWVEWPEDPIEYYDGGVQKNLYLEPYPYAFKHYGLIGYAYTSVEALGSKNTPSSVIALYWNTVATGHYQLIARGSDGVEHILVDWASSS